MKTTNHVNVGALPSGNHNETLVHGTKQSRPAPLLMLIALALSCTNIAAATDLSLKFPATPKICGVKDFPGVATYPDAAGVDPATGKATTQRQYVQQLFKEVKPEIVKLYGPPNISGSLLDVSVYRIGGNASMYLTGSLPYGKVAAVAGVASILAGPLGLPVDVLAAPCVALSDFPVHSIFISAAPDLNVYTNLEDQRNQEKNNRSFDQLFTHELVHAFHDRMDVIDWYTHSWVEEGLAEATAELVGESMLRQGTRNIVVSGIGSSAGDNLRHYDMWSFPGNGSETTPFFYPSEFSSLGGVQFFFVPNNVINKNIRYAAAASVWLMLTKALSPDPANPDFLKRLNAQLLLDNVTKVDGRDRAYRNILEEIQKVAGNATIEGLPIACPTCPTDWLRSQSLLKGAGSGDYIFVDVRDPQNLDLTKNPVTIYALYKQSPTDVSLLDLRSDVIGLILGDSAVGEMPAANCPLNVELYDSYNQLLFRDTNPNAKTNSRGIYVPDFSHAPKLQPAAYTIRVKAGTCDSLSIAIGNSHVPVGMAATTFAVVSGPQAHPQDILFGVTGTPGTQFGDFRSVTPVVAQTGASQILPVSQSLTSVDSPGAFTVSVGSSPSVAPQVVVGQQTPDGVKNSSTFLKPNPYTRVVWLQTKPDFAVSLSPDEVQIVAGQSTEATLNIIPNGVPRSAVSCHVRMDLLGGSVPGLTIDPPYSAVGFLGANAPNPAIIKLKTQAGTDVQPGAYTFTASVLGDGEGDCAGLVRTAKYTVRILKPVKLNINAVQITSNGATPITAPITVGSTTLQTPAVLSPPQFSPVVLTAQKTVLVAGKLLDFVNWEKNSDPNSRFDSNPIVQTMSDDVTITARYLAHNTVSLSVTAMIGRATASVNVAAPVAYSWSTSGGPVSATQTTTFEITPPSGASVTLVAAPIVNLSGSVYEFAGWEIGNQVVQSMKLVYQAASNATLNVRYQPASAHKAMFVSQSAPTDMTAGQTYPVFVTMKNVGSDTWTRSGLYRLGSQNPQGNLTWGLNRVDLPAASSLPGAINPATDSVVPGAQVTFAFNVIAPSTPGTYNLQWQMVQDPSTWFGDLTANVGIRVSAAIPNNSSFVIQSIPTTTMTAGQTYNVSITMKNTSANTWTAANGYALLSQGPQGNATWGLSSVNLPASAATVAPNSSVVFSFAITAPSSAGTYRFEWRMAQNGAGFGDFSPALSMVVQ